MIQLTRERTAQAIKAKFRGPTRAELFALLEARKFESKNWKPVKPQLKKEAAKKCAYCEAPAAVVAHCDVEHIRPKSQYWWLAYCYDNYSFSCQICNQTFKGDAWPLVVQTSRLLGPAVENLTGPAFVDAVMAFVADPLDLAAVTAYENLHRTETNLLLNPYIDDPSVHFAWEEDTTKRQIKLVPKAPGSKPHVEAAETFLGLNREELLDLRYKIFAPNAVLALGLKTPGLPAAMVEPSKNTLRAAIAPDAPFAGMMRFYVHDVWNLDLE